jgi:Skp family chaperone for outer membrane proteins
MKFHKLTALLFCMASYQLYSTTQVVVETSRIIKESLPGIALQQNMMIKQEEFSQPFKKIEAELKAKEASINDAQKALAKDNETLKTQKSLLSAEAQADKFEELQARGRNIEEQVADYQRAMRKAHEEAKKVDAKLDQIYRKELAAFEQSIKDTIQELRKEHNWDFVSAKESFLATSDAVDKTDLVMKKVNAKEEAKQKKSAEKKA